MNGNLNLAFSKWKYFQHMIFQMEIFAEHEVFKRPVVKLAVQNGNFLTYIAYVNMTTL